MTKGNKAYVTRCELCALCVIMKVEWLRMMSVEKALVIMGLFALFVQNHFALTIKMRTLRLAYSALSSGMPGFYLQQPPLSILHCRNGFKNSGIIILKPRFFIRIHS